MNWISENVRKGKLLSGIWISTGSPIVSEIAGSSGADWVLLDWEHGLGGEADLIHCLQAIRGTSAAPIVRVATAEPHLIKRALDQGASGIMVPWLGTSDQAEQIVSAMRYSPQGIRGVATSTPATLYGADTAEYLKRANNDLLTVIQIETPEAVKNADTIAAVDGVDVLFVGPSDLSFSMGIHRQIDHPDFRAAIKRVAEACATHGKQAGILANSSAMAQQAVADGFTFIAYGADISILTAGMQNCVNVIKNNTHNN